MISSAGQYLYVNDIVIVFSVVLVIPCVTQVPTGTDSSILHEFSFHLIPLT